MTKPSIAVIGGGASVLLFCCFIDSKKYNVTLYEKNNAIGRKLLVAGKGGFNLTHSEPISEMINRYTPTGFLKQSLLNFTNKDLINWLHKIRIETFVGSSKRVYPTLNIKPIDVVNTIKNVMINNGVKIKCNNEWTGWSKSELVFNHHQNIKADIVIFGLGGGSWKVTGSNSKWMKYFDQKGVKTTLFYPSNCAYRVNWLADFIKNNEGKPLKNIVVKCNGKTQKGEMVITQFGLEGNAIYALSAQIRVGLLKNNQQEISIDFKPMFTHQQLLEKYSVSQQKTISSILIRDLKLSKVQVDLLKYYLSKKRYTTPKCLINAIKSFKIQLVGVEELDKAISTVGGIELTEVDERFQLKQLSQHYCIGEMLNWDAPTGGYLLQGCFSMGKYLADWLNGGDFNN